MAGVRFALPAVTAHGDQVVPQVRIGQSIRHGLGVLLGGANGDQVDIGMAIEITPGPGSKQQHLLNADDLIHASLADLLGFAA